MMRPVRRGGPLVLAALLIATLAACSGGGSQPGASASPTAISTADILAIGREAAQCMRDHGAANFPDPVVDSQGRLQLPAGPAGDAAKQALSDNPAAQTACEAILNRLPPDVLGGNRSSVSQEDLANLLKFAQCVRQHGVPEWPDPKSDGSFPIASGPLAAEGKSPRLRNAFQACKEFWDKGIVGS